MFGITTAFFLFAVVGAISIVFVKTMVPETRGRPLEELDEQFRQKFGEGGSGSPATASAE